MRTQEHTPWNRLILTVFLCCGLAAGYEVLAAEAASAAKTAEVRGTLLNADGTPAVGYQVGLKNKAGDLFISAPTGKDGSFAVEALPPDSYRLTATSPEGTEFPVLGREVALKAGQVERTELRLGKDNRKPPGWIEPAKAGATQGAKHGLSRGWIIAIAVGGAFAVGLALSGGSDSKKKKSVTPSIP